MANEKEICIGSISPTISVLEYRQLSQVSKQVGFMLTKEEFKAIMAVYGKALDRILKENGITEEDNEN